MFDKPIDTTKVYGSTKFDKKTDRGLTNSLYRPKPKYLKKIHKAKTKKQMAEQRKIGRYRDYTDDAIANRLRNL